MDNFKQQLTKPILGPNKSPLLGGKFTNPYHLKSINPYYNSKQPSHIIINRLKNFHIQLPYVKGLQPNMENNINNLVLEFFGPVSSPMSGAVPIGGRTHIIHHPSRVATLNRISMGQKVVRQKPSIEKQTPFHNPLHTRDGLPPTWSNTTYKIPK